MTENHIQVSKHPPKYFSARKYNPHQKHFPQPENPDIFPGKFLGVVPFPNSCKSSQTQPPKHILSLQCKIFIFFLFNQMLIIFGAFHNRTLAHPNSSPAAAAACWAPLALTPSFLLVFIKLGFLADMDLYTQLPGVFGSSNPIPGLQTRLR